MLIHSRFICRELIQARGQALIFLLCVALSITTHVSLNSFKDKVHRSILADARTLQGGDIIIHSHQPFTPALQKAARDLSQAHRLTAHVQSHEFYSVVRAMTQARQGTLLCNIKVVGPAYPLYGRVELQSGRALARVLTAGQVVVEQELLDRLQLRVGDELHLGSATVRIADVVLHEPDRPLNLFSLGPRVLAAEADLAAMALVDKGSRVDHLLRLTLGEQTQIDQVATELSRHAVAGQERVETFRTASSGVKRFFDNLLFFLSLISVFTLLLAGIGMQSALTAWLRERRRTIAITKALGATNALLLRHYLLLVLFLGLIGCGLGLAAAAMLDTLFPLVFADVIPASGVSHGISPGQAGSGVLLGMGVVLLFTYLPLARLREVKPLAVFKDDAGPGHRGAPFWTALGLGLFLLTGLIIHQLDDVPTGLYFMLGAGVLLTVIALMTHLLLALGTRLTVAPLALRQAMRSLLRPGNASRAIIITLAAALSLLLTIHLVEANLNATFVASYPTDAQNLFCLDIQTGQKAAFTRLLPMPVELYPTIRARLIAINQTPIDRGRELAKKRDNLAREFNLTYRGELLADERLLAGPTLFRSQWSEPGVVQVSILDTVAEMGAMHLGDIVQFNIQGVPMTARVTSIRTRTRSRLYPFFYFVFQEEALARAPQTWFATITVDPATIPRLANTIVAAFPNISVINMAATAAHLGAILGRLTTIINFFALFTILAGGLIVVSSILATRLARIREAAYYIILGGTTRFVITVLAYENLLLGLGSSLLATILAQGASWAICRFLFDIPYAANGVANLVLITIATLLVMATGLISSVAIIRQKPALFLREQTDG
jgi:putative ABC transport system permease protein